MVKMTKEDIREYILSQLKTVQECAKSCNLNFLCRYLDLAEEILDEELQESDWVQLELDLSDVIARKDCL